MKKQTILGIVVALNLACSAAFAEPEKPKHPMPPLPPGFFPSQNGNQASAPAKKNSIARSPLTDSTNTTQKDGAGAIVKDAAGAQSQKSEAAAVANKNKDDVDTSAKTAAPK